MSERARLPVWFHLLLAVLAVVALARALAPFGNDPANLLYFPTFYAEVGAILGFHTCLAGAVIALLRPTRGALAVTAVGAAVVLVSLFGDGDVEFAKHSQLAPNVALASFGLVIAMLVQRALATRERA